MELTRLQPANSYVDRDNISSVVPSRENSEVASSLETRDRPTDDLSRRKRVFIVTTTVWYHLYHLLVKNIFSTNLSFY